MLIHYESHEREFVHEKEFRDLYVPPELQWAESTKDIPTVFSKIIGVFNDVLAGKIDPNHHFLERVDNLYNYWDTLRQDQVGKVRTLLDPHDLSGLVTASDEEIGKFLYYISDVYQIKGTMKALRYALRLVGMDAQVIRWYEAEFKQYWRDREGNPDCTVILKLHTGNNPVTDDMMEVFNRLLSLLLDICIVIAAIIYVKNLSDEVLMQDMVDGYVGSQKPKNYLDDFYSPCSFAIADAIKRGEANVGQYGVFAFPQKTFVRLLVGHWYDPYFDQINQFDHNPKRKGARLYYNSTGFYMYPYRDYLYPIQNQAHLIYVIDPVLRHIDPKFNQEIRYIAPSADHLKYNQRLHLRQDYYENYYHPEDVLEDNTDESGNTEDRYFESNPKAISDARFYTFRDHAYVYLTTEILRDFETGEIINTQVPEFLGKRFESLDNAPLCQREPNTLKIEQAPFADTITYGFEHDGQITYGETWKNPPTYSGGSVSRKVNTKVTETTVEDVISFEDIPEPGDTRTLFHENVAREICFDGEFNYGSGITYSATGYPDISTHTVDTDLAETIVRNQPLHNNTCCYSYKNYFDGKINYDGQNYYSETPCRYIQPYVSIESVPVERPLTSFAELLDATSRIEIENIQNVWTETWASLVYVSPNSKSVFFNGEFKYIHGEEETPHQSVSTTLDDRITPSIVHSGDERYNAEKLYSTPITVHEREAVITPTTVLIDQLEHYEDALAAIPQNTLQDTPDKISHAGKILFDGTICYNEAAFTDQIYAQGGAHFKDTVSVNQNIYDGSTRYEGQFVGTTYDGTRFYNGNLNHTPQYTASHYYSSGDINLQDAPHEIPISYLHDHYTQLPTDGAVHLTEVGKFTEFIEATERPILLTGINFQDTVDLFPVRFDGTQTYTVQHAALHDQQKLFDGSVKYGVADNKYTATGINLREVSKDTPTVNISDTVNFNETCYLLVLDHSTHPPTEYPAGHPVFLAELGFN